MQVTVEHLDELAAVFRTGWDRRVLERRAAPVLRVLIACGRAAKKISSTFSMAW